jgi:hypothetical protein
MRGNDGEVSRRARGSKGRRMTLVAALVTAALVALVALSQGGTGSSIDGLAQADESKGTAVSSSASAGVGSSGLDAVKEDEAAASAATDAGIEASLEAAREAYARAVPQESGTCYDCHSDVDALSASLNDPADDANKYLVDESFATSTHGVLGCTYCHGGHADQADADAAMEGMNATPTADGGSSVCGTCHEQEVANFATSLHNTTAGIKNAWENRLSAASDELGTDLAGQYYHHDGYEGSCIDCHATCGECHVRSAKDLIDPDTGLTDGHNFVDLTDNDDITYTCLSCHAGSIAGCYTNYDVHGLSGANMNCMDCHDVSELHGDGNEYQTMSHSGAITTEFTDCHDVSTLDGEWHSDGHLSSNECWACHTSTYNTCESCHGWFASERDANDVPIEQHEDCYLGYDLADGKITTLVKAPIDAGMLGDSSNLKLTDEQLNTGSTWYPGFTHGVIKPEVNQEFCNRCHGEGTELLTEGDLQFPDYESDQLVGELPEVNVEDYE